MTVRVRAFALHRELLGRDALDVEIPDGEAATPRKVFEKLYLGRPDYARLLRATMFAVNREYVGPDDPIADGAELALIPPVAGGCGDVPREIA